ncbi:GNAT family N-acetyltransferase [Amycolatopsis sp. K13G38]|uniref:GNAT family N-acetyltransferase n=1 Tax=Amycolatopsis acididurans TaxID=2724524 RepID=A0ABX1JIP2_9PSEU|nr:GNAT family N-acetyltransferase [Amycolatopsis acididurans]NKQ58715.1 GNAT family N-acetyltransferase [Amycolatopsis acididurans]
MLQPTYPIRTARLALRPFKRGDLAALHAIHSHPDVTRHLGWAPPGNRAESARLLDTKIAQSELAEPGQALALGVELITSRELIGDLSLRWYAEDKDSGEILVLFHPRHHGRGYAAEATTELLRLAFDSFGLERVHGYCDPGNIASASLMEGLGLRREPSARHDGELAYAMSAGEWKRG